jgi:hypothetical protein
VHDQLRGGPAGRGSIRLIGYQALEHGAIANASGIAWFVLRSAALGVVATRLRRLFGGESESLPLLLGGASTGAMALAALTAWFRRGGLGFRAFFSVFGLFGGAVLGFCFSVLSLFVAEHGPWRVLRDVLREQAGR